MLITLGTTAWRCMTHLILVLLTLGAMAWRCFSYLVLVTMSAIVNNLLGRFAQPVPLEAH